MVIEVRVRGSECLGTCTMLEAVGIRAVCVSTPTYYVRGKSNGEMSEG